MKLSQELARAPRAAPRGHRPRLHHRQRRQRRRRHLHLFAGRRAVRLLAALDDDPDHHRADRRAGDGVADGRGDRQGPERSDSRGVRLPGDVLPDGGAGRHQLRQRRRRVRRHREQPRAVRRVEVHRRAGGGGRSSGCWSCAAPTTASRRSSWPRRRSTSATSSPAARAPGLEGRGVRHRDAARRRRGIRNYGYLYMVIALVGTTIAPWMQFYLQASIVEKGHHRPAVRARRGGTSSSAASSPTSSPGSSSSRARRRSTRPAITTSAAPPTRRRRCGRWPANTPTCCSPPACSTRRCSPRRSCRSRPPTRCAKGWDSSPGLDKKFHEAPVFYWLYTLLIVLGAGVLLVPRLPLVYVAVLSQVANGVVLPLVLIFMLLLTNDRELMGEHVNSRGVQRRRLDHRRRDDRADDPDGADTAVDGQKKPQKNIFLCDPGELCGCFYSALSASTGSSAEARRAGRMLAVTAMARSSAVAPANAPTSNGDTP